MRENPWKTFFGLCSLLNTFPDKKLSNAWKNGNLLARGRESVVDESVFQTSSYSVFPRFVVRHLA